MRKLAARQAVGDDSHIDYSDIPPLQRWARTAPTMPTSPLKCHTLCIYPMRFEWDENKNRLNQKIHDGVDFDLASRVFADENFLIEADRVADGEERWHAIGRVGDLLVLTVVHTQKELNGQEIIRIISAREANKQELRRYFQQAPL